MVLTLFVLAVLIVILFVRVHGLKTELVEFQAEMTRVIGQLGDQLKAAVGDRPDDVEASRPDTGAAGYDADTGKPVIEPTRIPPPPEVPPASPVPPSTSDRLVSSTASMGKTAAFPEGGPGLSTPTPSPKSEGVSPPPIPPSPLVSGLSEWAMGPLASTWEYIAGIYHYYQERDKLPVFFLTAMGIIALSVGLGYFLQYSFTNYLSEVAKVFLGFAGAAGIIVVGARLIGRHEQYRDYGSGLIGLGLILNYICIYFLSTYYGIVSSALGFSLIIVNTLAAVILALRFETRVVSVVTLVGGAFTPFYLDSEAASPLFFMSYLWLLCAGSVYLARRIDWKTLGTLSFFVGWGLVEFTVGVLPDAAPWPATSLLVHLFVYLFLYQSLIERRTFRETLARDDVLILAGSMILFLYNHFDMLGSVAPAGLIYLLNAVPFLYLGLTSRVQASPSLRAVLLTVAMTLVGFAVPALFGKHLMGLFWGQEALFMVFLGFLFRLPVVRREGYVLFLVAVGQIAYTLPEIWESWSQTLWTGAYLNLWALPALCYVLKWLIGRYPDRADRHEVSLGTFATESLSYLLAAVYLLAGLYYVPDHLVYATIPLTFALLFWGYHRDLTFTKVLGFVLYTLVVMKCIFSTVIMIETWPPDSLWGLEYGNLVLVGGLLYSLKCFMQKYAHDEIGSSAPVPLTAAMSLWAVVLFYVTAFYFLPGPALILSPLPMFALIYWGSRRTLPFTHLLGYACYALIIIEIGQSMLSSHSGYFSDQTFYGKCAMIEALFILWFLKYFYERWIRATEGSRLETVDTVRELFYLLCPLVLLTPVRRHLPHLFPLALWGSTAICYGMFGLLKRNALRYELHVLIGIAVVWGSVNYLSVPDRGILAPGGLTLLAGVAFLLFLLLHKEGYTRGGSHNPQYRHLFRLTYYYSGWCLFLLCNFLLYDGHLGGLYALPLTGLFFMILVSLRSRIYALESDLPFMFRLTQGLTILSLLRISTAQIDSVPLGTGLPVFILLVAIGTLYYRLIATGDDFHPVPTVSQSGVLQHGTRWVFDIYLLHSIFLATYLASFHYLTGEWLGPMLTVALVFHAIFLLFQSIQPRYQLLNRSSVILFVTAGVKLFVHDLSGFSLIQKILVFIVIGTAMLVSAYYFQRIKIRLSNA